MSSLADMVTLLEAQLEESQNQNRLKDKLIHVADRRIALRNLAGASETLVIQLQEQRMNYDNKHMKFLKRIALLFPHFTTSCRYQIYAVRYSVIETKYSWVFSAFNAFTNKLILGLEKRHDSVPFIQPLLIEQNLDFNNMTMDGLDDVLEQLEQGIAKARDLNMFLTALLDEWMAISTENNIDSEASECIQMLETLLRDIHNDIAAEVYYGGDWDS